MTAKWGGERPGGPPQLPAHAPAQKPARQARAPRGPREPRQIGYIGANFGWPFLIVLTLSISLALLRVGWPWLEGADRHEMARAVEQAGKLFLLSFFVLSVLLLTGPLAMRYWLPVILAKIEHPGRPKASKSPPRAIQFNGPRQRRQKRQRRFRERERATSGAFQGVFRGAGQLMGRVGRQLAAPPAPRRRTVTGKRGAFEQDARPVRATFDHTRPEYEGYRDLFAVTHAMYGQDLRRDEGAWRVVLPDDNWQRMYAQFKEAWIDRGWIKVNGKGTITGWTVDNEWQLYASDPVLRKVATQMGYKWPERGIQ